jgi:transposase-like protein
MEKCKYCGGGVWKHGINKGIQRYKCKTCGRCSSDSLPKYSDADRRKAIKMYLNNCGVRKTALFMGCSPGTILNWVRETACGLKLENHSIDGDIIEMDEIFAQADRRIPTVVKKNGLT